MRIFHGSAVWIDMGQGWKPADREFIEALPGARWDMPMRMWRVPMMHLDALREKFPAAIFVANDGDGQ